MGEFKLTQKQMKLLGFVQEAHNNCATPKRKYDGLPYWTHPLAVAKIVDKYLPSFGIEVALLHDILEDTELTSSDIYRVLDAIGYYPGDKTFIVDRVLDLTDVYTTEDYPHLNRRQRKEFEADRLGKCRAFSQTVKYADLIHNSHTIVEGDPKFAKVYLQEKGHLLGLMTKGNQNLRNICTLELGIGLIKIK